MDGIHLGQRMSFLMCRIHSSCFMSKRENISKNINNNQRIKMALVEYRLAGFSPRFWPSLAGTSTALRVPSTYLSCCPRTSQPPHMGHQRSSKVPRSAPKMTSWQSWKVSRTWSICQLQTPRRTNSCSRITWAPTCSLKCRSTTTSSLIPSITLTTRQRTSPPTAATHPFSGRPPGAFRRPGSCNVSAMSEECQCCASGDLLVIYCILKV